ncbi:MAG: methyltransferase MtaB domain-containing protein [Nitrososphaerales archaeon]
MVKFRYTKMAYADPDDMVFGHAIYPVFCKNWNIQFGAGYVVPEVKVAPRPGTGDSLEKLKAEHEKITRDACDRAAAIGIPFFMIEQEHVFQQTYNPKWAGEITALQASIIEEYVSKYGMKAALRQTVGDIRVAEKPGGLREALGSEYDRRIAETVEECCKNGASDICMETMGGKEVVDYGCMRQDIRAILFGIGYLGSIDMEYVWDRNVKICSKYSTNPGGETNCSGANTLMFVAGGLTAHDFPHTIAMLGRAIAAARTLVAYECGAVGPHKDCAYEGPIVKAVSGRPGAQEGKQAVCAHGDVMGNTIAAVCDVWSNESVEYHSEFGGTTPAVWLQATAMEAALMNTAIQTGQAKVLRDLYTLTDRYRDPQGYCLSYDNAWRIGKALVEYGKDIYLRARAAALEAGKIMKEAHEKREVVLTRFELDSLERAMAELEAMTTETPRWVEKCIADYKRKVPNFKPENYGL